MAKDALGLEWKSRDPDDSLYTAMIWALSIGIVVVIVTLFLTRPSPESFSEIYFNNHTTLPEYVNLNVQYPYSFTIHNLENKNTTYNYTISTEYYDLDYSCERPELYLEISSNDTIPSRITETNDPSLYIKESSYNVSFNYELKDGAGRIAFKLLDINNSIKYQVVLDYNARKVYIITSTNVTSANFKSNTSLHSLKMQVRKSNFTIIIDSQTFTIPTPKDYTNGFVQFETIGTYAEFTNLIIERRNAKMPVYLRIADSQYTEYKTISSNNTITTGNPINLSNYNVKATFRTFASKMITLKLSDTTTIAYIKDSSQVVINNSGIIEKYYVDDPKSLNDLTATVTNESIKVYYNGAFITVIENNNSIIVPSITYNNVTVSDFYIKSNDAPITINYNIDAASESTAGLLTVDALKYFKNEETNATLSNATTVVNPTINNITRGLSVDEVSYLEEYYERSKITYDDYRISATYTDRTKNNTLVMAMASINGTIYSVTLYDSLGFAQIQYLENKTLQYAFNNFTSLSTNRLTVDANNNTLSVSVNGKNIFYKKVTKYNDGVILFDYKNLTITNAQIENRRTGSTIIFQKQLNLNCEPILTNSYIQHSNISIPNKNLSIIKNSVKFNSTFDIAKVQVSLDNNQEIHFWAKLI